MLKNSCSCFDKLSMNGKTSMISTPRPFVLSLVEGRPKVVQCPTGLATTGNNQLTPHKIKLSGLA
jgi:hypothetical protein